MTTPTLELQQTLLAIAYTSLCHGLEAHAPWPVDATLIDASLSELGACFVTLKKEGHLRGCIGSLEARQALAIDVSQNSFNAGFRDPRFPPLNADELSQLDIEVSILTPAEAMDVDSQQQLLEQLRPQIDGLIIEDGGHRATFLPSVWESLPNAVDFLDHLKLKAGLKIDHWSPTFKAWRYQTLACSATSATLTRLN